MTDELGQSVPGDGVLTEHARTNREFWNRNSDTYEERHAADLEGVNAMSWGLWRIPESELRVLGDVSGKDVLELGCGAARWSIALAQRGARPVGLDLSVRQLRHARRLMQEAGVDFPLIEASAESVPLPDAGFDVVFCDWGAMTFSDPLLTVPEAARLLRSRGLFAFSTGTPIASMCDDAEQDTVVQRLEHDYFGMHRLDWGDEVNFQLPYGEWIRLFVTNGFAIEDLIETRPPDGISTSYRSDPEIEWARHWPMENLWRVRKL